MGEVSRLPVCIRIVLESLLRNYDGKKILESDIRTLASWQPKGRADCGDSFYRRQGVAPRLYRSPTWSRSGGDAISRSPNGEISLNH